MRFSLLLVLDLSSCSGPYSRTKVAADEEKPIIVKTIHTALQRIPEESHRDSGRSLPKNKRLLGSKRPAV